VLQTAVLQTAVLQTAMVDSNAFTFPGFSTWLVQYLVHLRRFPVWLINLIVSLFTATITEVVSNTAAANILLPILKEMSITLCANPTYLGNLPYMTLCKGRGVGAKFVEILVVRKLIFCSNALMLASELDGFN